MSSATRAASSARVARSRATSPVTNAGAWKTRSSSAAASPACSARTAVPHPNEAEPALGESDPPSRSNASASPAASRPPAPRTAERTPSAPNPEEAGASWTDRRQGTPGGAGPPGPPPGARHAERAYPGGGGGIVDRPAAVDRERHQRHAPLRLEQQVGAGEGHVQHAGPDRPPRGGARRQGGHRRL